MKSTSVGTIFFLASIMSGACGSSNPSNLNVDSTPVPTTQMNANRRSGNIPGNQDPLIIAEIDSFALKASIKSLKDKKLGEQDAEVRLWNLGSRATSGLIIVHQGSRYT